MFKAIFGDLTLVFKNFIHWNISKILIHLSSIGLGILLSLPFFIIMVIIAYIDPINWNEVLYPITSGSMISASVYTSFFTNIGFFIAEIILFILAIAMIYFGFSYKIILFSKLNLSYINGEKLAYKGNDYFNFKLIWAYFGVLGWGCLVLLIPIIIFLILFGILVFSFGGITSVVSLTNGGVNTFTILTLVLFILTVLSFLYLSYKITFSFINIVDKNRFPNIEKNTKKYVKDSFEISGGIKIFKFILFLLILGLITLPFSYVGDFYITNIYSYIAYTIFIFVVFSGLFEMLIVSLYKRVMLADSNGRPVLEDNGIEEKLVDEVITEKKAVVKKKAVTKKKTTVKKEDDKKSPAKKVAAKKKTTTKKKVVKDVEL